MGTLSTWFKASDGLPKNVGDVVRMLDGHKWTVIDVLDSRENGEQLLRFERPDPEPTQFCDCRGRYFSG